MVLNENKKENKKVAKKLKSNIKKINKVITPKPQVNNTNSKDSEKSTATNHTATTATNDTTADDIAKKKLINLKKVYLFLSELSQSQLNDFRSTVIKKKYELKSHYKYVKATTQNIIVSSNKDIYENYNFNKSFNSYYLYRDLTNKLFLKKLSNILMIHGKRSVAMRIFFKFFEILKLKYKISDPIRLLKYYIFKNLVPVIQTKLVGFKTQKVVGISLSVFKRIGISLKLFIKGAKMYNHPIVLGLIIEFLKFSKKKTLLQISNKKTLSDIKTNNLYKFLQLDSNSILPEKKFLSSILPKKVNKNLFTLKTLIKINWDKFDSIVYKLKLDNNKQIQKRQFLILEELKSYIINSDKLNVSDNNLFYNLFKEELLSRVNLSIKESLTEKDINILFLNTNSNNFDLDLESSNFKDIKEIINIFKNFDIWKSQKVLNEQHI